MKKVVCSTFPNKASETFAVLGAVPNTNFHQETFVKDFASVEAHNAKMALAEHSHVSDREKKNVRAYYCVVKRMPLDFTEDAMETEEFQRLVKQIGKRGLKRKAPFKTSQSMRGHASLLIQEAGARLL